MKRRGFSALLVAAVFVVCAAGVGLASHEEEKGAVKGTVTGVKIVEIEISVKDDRGKETKVKTGDTTFQLGDRVFIKDGKVSREVKPKTGGY